jgi:hypothetical protein
MPAEPGMEHPAARAAARALRAGGAAARTAAAGAFDALAARRAGEREAVRRAAFLDLGGGELLLLLSYDSGWQLWSAPGGAGGEEPRELASRRDGGVVAAAAALPPPREADSPGDPLYDARPALALAPVGASRVEFNSLSRCGIVHGVVLDAPALSLAASSRLVVAALGDGRLVALDARTLQPAFTIVAAPAPAPAVEPAHESGAPVFTLGERWLAHAAQPPAASAAAAAAAGGGGAVALRLGAPAAPAAGLSAAAARAVGGWLAAAGAGAARALGRRLTGGAPGTPPAAAGGVLVRDVLDRRGVVHFRAHRAPLAAAAFDASGVLLATASTEGAAKLWRLAPGTAEMLFRLERGALTRSLVCELAVSADARWATACSARGTCHVFALPDVEGGAAPAAALRAAARAREPGLLATAAAAAAAAAGGPGPGAATSVTAAFGPGSSLLVAGADGVLTRHELAAPGGGADAVLGPAASWDVGRHASWPESESPLPAAPAAPEGGEWGGDWVAAAGREICAPAPALCAGPQFFVGGGGGGAAASRGGSRMSSAGSRLSLGQ